MKSAGIDKIFFTVDCFPVEFLQDGSEEKEASMGDVDKDCRDALVVEHEQMSLAQQSHFSVVLPGLQQRFDNADPLGQTLLASEQPQD